MSRRARTTIVFLLLGAIVNILTAWGAASWQPNNVSRIEATSQWPAPVAEYWPDAPYEVLIYDSPTLRIRQASGVDDLSSWQHLYGYVSIGAGWPARSMRWDIYDDMAHIAGSTDYWPWQSHGIIISGIDPPGWLIRQDEWRFQRRLPIRPIWPGFLINTLFYAALLWLLFCGPGKVRRFVRIRRGRCPKCGYPIGQSPMCTECGADLKRWRFSSRKETKHTLASAQSGR